MTYWERTPAHRLLLVEGCQIAGQNTAAALRSTGFDVKMVATPHAAMQVMRQRQMPDLLLVAAGNDPTAACDFCRAVQRFSDLPIVLIAEVNDGQFIAQALDAFAEDVVIRPFSPVVLATRIRRILRRLGRVDDQSLAIEWPRRRLTVGETAVVLSPLESRLLYILLRRRGETVSNEYILRRLWPTLMNERDNVRTAVFRLRRKLKRALSHNAIVARAGGYALQSPVLEWSATHAAAD